MHFDPNFAASDSWPTVSLADVEPTSGGEHESPSLRSADCGDPPSYELKFVLAELVAADLESQFSSWLSLDPHADAACDHHYRVSTVYSDTPRFDVFHRAGSHRRTKFRLRRYGDASTIYLERKTKRGRQVLKERVGVQLDHLHRLSDAGHADWAGEDFRIQLQRRSLLPVCALTYLRRAYFGSSDEGRLRVTFDRQLRGGRVDGWDFSGPEDGVELANGLVICEFKFRGAMPTAFKRAIEQLHVLPGGFSKYRGCMEAHGLARRERLAHA